jgi:hypothetical protein
MHPDTVDPDKKIGPFRAITYFGYLAGLAFASYAHAPLWWGLLVAAACLTVRRLFLFARHTRTPAAHHDAEAVALSGQDVTVSQDLLALHVSR